MDIKDIQITMPMLRLDEDYTVDLICSFENGQDTGNIDEIWCFYGGSLLCKFKDLDKFYEWFKLTTQKEYWDVLEEQKKEILAKRGRLDKELEQLDKAINGTKKKNNDTSKR